MITKSQIETAKNPQGQEGHDTLVRMNQSHDTMTNWALSQIPEYPVSTVLDVGCGGGATVGRLLAKYPGAFVNGIDYSEESIACSKAYTATMANCQISQGDVHNLDFPQETFDLVTAFETVYFWQDIPRAFSEVSRVLRPKGRFLICCEMSDPTNPKWKNILTEMTIQTKETWAATLETSGFSVEVCTGQNEWFCIIASKN